MSGQKITGSVALVTGANRGIGRAIAGALLERGASKLYAGARRKDSLADLVTQYGDRVVPLTLDVTNADQMAAAAKEAEDLTLLVNNAGVVSAGMGTSVTSQDALDAARAEMEVNYFGVLRALHAFTPAIARNGGGSIVNVSSVAGLSNFPVFATYSASKAAVHSLTQATRAELSAQGIQAIGVYPGPVDTDMAEALPWDKATPTSVANAVLDGITAGTEDVYPDAFAVDFGAQFEAGPKQLELNNRQVANQEA